MYKKNPSTPDLHINCNLTSDNRPKIHPETKVLIIKRLKTRSTAEVADTFNVSQHQLQRIRKRYEETGDVFDKPRSGRPRKTTAREDRLLAQKSKAGPFSTGAELHKTWSPEVPVSTRTVCRILSRNALHVRISAQKPALNKRQFKNRVAFAKAHSLPKGMDAGKVAEGGFLRWIFGWITSQSPPILQETYWSPHGSEIHPENSQVCWRKNHGLGLYPVWGCARDLQGGRQHQLSKIATSYIPNHKRGQILQQDGAPSHTSISTSKFLKAKKIKVLQDWPAQSPDMNIIEHVWGRMKEEAWKTKQNNLDELWEACKTAFFAIPDDFINTLYEFLYLKKITCSIFTWLSVGDKTFVLPKSDLSVFIKW